MWLSQFTGEYLLVDREYENCPFMQINRIINSITSGWSGTVRGFLNSAPLRKTLTRVIKPILDRNVGICHATITSRLYNFITIISHTRNFIRPFQYKLSVIISPVLYVMGNDRNLDAPQLYDRNGRSKETIFVMGLCETLLDY